MTMPEDDVCRSLDDYPGLVFHRDGSVYNTKSKRFITGWKDSRGYYHLELRHRGLGLPLVHRLIARAFHPNPDGLPCVHHVDGNQTNNEASNLVWCTQKYNTQGLNRKNGFGNIQDRQRGLKRFQVQFKKNKGKNVCRYFATREEAQEYLDKEADVAKSEMRVDM